MCKYWGWFMLVVSGAIKIPLREIQFTFVKGEGPGGQHVNKRNSRAVLVWNIEKNSSLPVGLRDRIVESLGRRVSHSGEITIRSNRFRDRGRNIADCLEKLKDMLIKASHQPTKRVPTKPKKAKIEKRLESKRRHSEIKKMRKKVSYQ